MAATVSSYVLPSTRSASPFAAAPGAPTYTRASPGSKGADEARAALEFGASSEMSTSAAEPKFLSSTTPYSTSAMPRPGRSGVRSIVTISSDSEYADDEARSCGTPSASRKTAHRDGSTSTADM
eukprot:scaffold2172_cov130-Isochrysis_galbana.AAC.8